MSKNRLNNNMSFEQFKGIIDQIPTLKSVHLQGYGEPLLNLDLEKILIYCKDRGIETSTTINGSMLTDKNIELILNNLNSVGISFDSVNKDNFEKIRVGSHFDDIIINIKKLIDKRKEINSKLKITLSFVASHLNYKEIPDFKGLCKNLGVDCAGFVEVENWTTKGEPEFDMDRIFILESRKVSKEINDSIYKDEDIIVLNNLMSLLYKNKTLYKTVRYLYQPLKRNSKKKRSLQIGFMTSKKRREICKWTFERCFITVDGFVTPCCIRMNPDIINFGNIYKENFVDIWNSDKINKFRKEMKGKNPNVICGLCPD